MLRLEAGEQFSALATELGVLARAITANGIAGPAIIFGGIDWAQAGLLPPDRVEVYEPAGNELTGQPDVAAAAPPSQG